MNLNRAVRVAARVAASVVLVTLAVTAGGGGLAGCSIFPYDSHFLCEKTDDYGHCTSVQGAYQDATNGDTANAHAADVKNGMEKKPVKSSDPCCNTDAAPREPPVDSSRDAYKDAEYRAMAGMIDSPVAPVVAPPKVLRTLILPYSNGQTMYMPRYVFSVVDQAHFVLGGYPGMPVPGTPTLYPNGVPSMNSGGP